MGRKKMNENAKGIRKKCGDCLYRKSHRAITENGQKKGSYCSLAKSWCEMIYLQCPLEEE